MEQHSGIKNIPIVLSWYLMGVGPYGTCSFICGLVHQFSLLQIVRSRAWGHETMPGAWHLESSLRTLVLRVVLVFRVRGPTFSFVAIRLLV